MNKKKLSVVMAGAMLASSVAPVLAAVEKTEVSAANLGLLIRDLREKLNSAKFADEAVNGASRGKSIYEIKVDGVSQNLDVNSTQAEFQAALGNLKADQKVTVWTKAHVEKDGKYYAYEEQTPVYTDATLKDAADALYSDADQADPGVQGAYTNALVDPSAAVLTGSTGAKKLTITFKSNVHNDAKDLVIVLKTGSKVLDFSHYISADGTTKAIAKLASAGSGDFKGFREAAKSDLPVTTGIEQLSEITITSGGNNYAVEDLYDGLMLTTAGHDFFNLVKEAEAERTVNGAATNRCKIIGNLSTNELTQADANKIASVIGKGKDDKYSFTVKVAGGASGSVQTPIEFTVTGKNEAETERLASWILAGQAKVDILAGSNRYATAVTIAKEYAKLTGSTVSNGGNAKIVLVNGDSLVDGLAASPLASALTGNDADNKAPILLTESDRLPSETKAYLKEVISNVAIGSLKNAELHIVGGESVVSKSLERELKSLGFKVVRYGGDNREETSLKVAEKISELQNGKADTDAFVVGANGEADAMSIAAVASAKGNDTQTPIIVAKNGGLSDDAMYELRGKNVTIIGGEAAISKAEEEEIGLEAESVARIAGKNRQETNALIIEKYYDSKFASNVIVAKDGQHKKSELIDALAAANFASKVNAPIVLATNKLSDSQINALELNAQSAESLYQVGIGVDRDNVVKVIANLLGLAN
ncbi:cell wall-binding repeat-containing protein [uncultured Fusobacterium sp.]|uniref:cell wall-binding repeat-containing protein n=1 Tax=uncultured Fusobacterium sp. TaxID=159267 RepID=UPI0025FE09C8|nr:cell wall-binding repeat-containing protein [uncultured Fusobacterium sp.]